MKILMAVANAELEHVIEEHVGQECEVIDDIAMIEEILSYEKYDRIIINTILSKKKSKELAQFIYEYESEEITEKPKIVALIPDYEDHEFLLQMAGCGVNGFVRFDQMESIKSCVEKYPPIFDWAVLEKTKKIRAEAKTVPHCDTKVKLIGTISVGFFNLAHGAGATTTAVDIAEQLYRLGFEVAVIAMDDRVDMDYLNKKEKKATYVVPVLGEKELQFLDTYHQRYDFVLLDFGNLFDISPAGILKAESLVAKTFEIDEFHRCTYKVGVGFGDDWNIGKLKYFINNPVLDQLDSFLFMIRGTELNQLAKRYDLNFCGDVDTVLNVLLELLGLQKGSEQNKRAFPFLWR